MLSWVLAGAMLMPGPGIADRPDMAARADAVQPTQAALDALARGMGYRFTIVDNRPECPQGLENCFLSTIKLTVPRGAGADWAARDLALYFSFVSRLPRVESDVFDHALVNGDLQRLTLKSGATLKPGATYTIRLWGIGNHFSKAFAMPNAYLAAEGLAARTIDATRTRVDPDTGVEFVPFVAPMVDEARLATSSPDDRTRWLTAARAFDLQASRPVAPASGVVVVPKPTKAEQRGGAPLDLRRGVAVKVEGIDSTALAPALAALAAVGAKEGGGVPLTVTVDPASGIAAEGYVLDATAKGIAIRAGDADGARHGLRSLAQQVAFEDGRLRPIRIEDAPRYGFRGLHLDLGRNFHGRDQILKLVEAMAAYKLNKLHLHLADDEGWRIAIPALPELTELGSKRCHDPSETRCILPQLGAGTDEDNPVNGFLSEDDYRTIVRAATARGIEVIPSIDMPGHSRAAIRSMELRYRRFNAAGRGDEATRYRLIDPADTTDYRSIQNYDDNTLNVCLPSTYRFVETVVDGIATLHREAGAPLKTFHLGADETAGAWVESPACRSMIAENGGDARQLTPRFIERVSTMLAERGIRAGGWSDGMGHTDPARMPRDVQTNIWGGIHGTGIPEAHDQANRGWTTVLSIPELGYLDMPYVPHPDEGGYDWASRGTDTYQVFGFMPGNLPANGVLIRDIQAKPGTIADKPPLADGRAIAGVQAQLWSETLRSDAQMDQMLFPRLLALAERGWSATPWAPDYVAGATYAWHDPRVDRAMLAAAWSDFAGRVTAQLPLLDRAGIGYRVAPPGARIAGGMLQANTVFPGTAIEYRGAGGDWTPYRAPVAVTAPVEVRTRSADGRRASRTVVATEDTAETAGGQ